MLETFAKIDQHHIEHENKHALVVKPRINNHDPNVLQRRGNQQTHTHTHTHTHTFFPS